MGSHKPGQVIIGAFVELGLRDYLDKLTAQRGYLTRSDSLRAVIREHRLFSTRINTNWALTLSNVVSSDNHTEVKK